MFDQKWFWFVFVIGNLYGGFVPAEFDVSDEGSWLGHKLRHYPRLTRNYVWLIELDSASYEGRKRRVSIDWRLIAPGDQFELWDRTKLTRNRL